MQHTNGRQSFFMCARFFVVTICKRLNMMTPKKSQCVSLGLNRFSWTKKTMSLFSTCIQTQASRFARKLVASHFSFRYVNCCDVEEKNMRASHQNIVGTTQWNWPLRNRHLEESNDQNTKQNRLSFSFFNTMGEIFQNMLPIGLGTCAPNNRRWIPCDNTFYYTYIEHRSLW